MAIGYGDEQQQQQLPKERHHQLRSVDNNMSDGRQTIVDNDVQPYWFAAEQMSYSPTSQQGGNINGQIYHLKILVPAVAAGAIIGKGGETIGQLQKETNARVKMSKANDFYPGTSERVCLISGSVDGIMRINEFIMEKIKEKPDPNAKMAIDFDNKQPAEREKQVKILVPNSTAGMIIGKAGSYIKHIKEESGAYVQISQKSLDHALAERCITVIGDYEYNKKACQMILAKIVEDPQSGSCLNVSYADVTGPVANFNPTGSPYANAANSSMGNSNNSNPNYSSNGSLNSMSPTLNNSFNGGQGVQNSAGNMMQFGNVFQSGAAAASNGSAQSSQMIENFRGMLRACGYTEDAVNEICNAMATLANYGMLGLGLGLGNGMMNGTPILGNLSMGLGPGTPTQSLQMSGVSPSAHAHHHQNTLFSAGGGGGMSALDQSGCTNVPSVGGGGNGGNNMFGPIGTVGGGSLSMGGMGGPFAHHNSPTGGGGPRSHPHDSRGLHMGDTMPVFETFRASPSSLSSPVSSQVVHPSLSLVSNSNSFGIPTGSSSSATGGLPSPTLNSRNPNSSSKNPNSPTPSLDQQSDLGLGGGGRNDPNATKYEMEVSDNIIGAILGHGGKLLVHFQNESNASIQISKKGTFAPGTRNRIVTIIGNPAAISHARNLISGAINDEETKRSTQQQQQQQQQSPQSTIPFMRADSGKY